MSHKFGIDGICMLPRLVYKVNTKEGYTALNTFTISRGFYISANRLSVMGSVYIHCECKGTSEFTVTH